MAFDSGAFDSGAFDAPSGGGGGTATLLGTEVLTLSTTNPTPGAQSITVPSGTQGVVVMARANSPGLTLTSSFAGTWTNVPPSSGVERLQYAPVTATGAQTITPNWGAFIAEGPVFFIFYIGNIDNSAPANWVRDAATGEVNTQTIDSETTDLVLGLDSAVTTTSAIPGNETGWTSLATSANGNLSGRARQADSPGSPTTTMNRQRNGTATDFHGLGMISIIGASAGPTIVSATQSLAWSVRNFATGSQSTAWSVRNFATGSRSLAWSVRNFASASQSIAWSVRNFATGTQALAWSVRNFVSTTQALAWSVRNFATATQDIAWSVAGAGPTIVTATQSIAWTVRNQVAAAQTISWSVRNFATGSQALAWSVRNFATGSQTVAWTVRNSVTASRSLAWSVRNFATGSRSVAWSVRNFATAFQNVSWSVQSDVIPDPTNGLLLLVRRRRR